MSETIAPQQSAICPGQKALFAQDAHQRGLAEHLRVVFTVYWGQGSGQGSPSTEVFYLAGWPLRLTIEGIAALEDAVLTTLLQREQDNAPKKVIFITYTGILMSRCDIEAASWRVIGPPAESDPI